LNPIEPKPPPPQTLAAPPPLKFRPSSGQRCAAVPSRPRRFRALQELRIKVVMLFDPFSPSILLFRARISSSEQAPPPFRHAP